ncbi:MAG: universal stress protein [Candidatus Promineifilaceae bacterium]|nr:universal stress protein [Candidatus Promineifilaceae bacterium]
MSGIVCPIRGGAASRSTIDKAIAIAQETGLPVYFLYVLDLGFLMHTMHVQTGTISRELRELGEFILLTAQDRAAREGVQAETVLREGEIVREAIAALCREIDADYVIMGRPVEARDRNVFTPEMLERLTRDLEAEMNATVVFAGEA